MAQEIEDKKPLTQTSAPSALSKMSYEEFLSWAEDGSHVEWVDGEVIIMSPTSHQHQGIADFLTALLRHFVEANELGIVLSSRFQMKLSTRPSGREPDVMFVSNERLAFLRDAYLDGPADLAVEIISPESEARDRGEKFSEYEQAGVREYWLIDPFRKQTDFYLLGDDDIYEAASVGADGIFHSRELDGLYLKTEWLFQEPMPLLVSILKEWKIV
jgi:Uma2 family endonuclease